jgi:hypothetical protein
VGQKTDHVRTNYQTDDIITSHYPANTVHLVSEMKTLHLFISSSTVPKRELLPSLTQDETEAQRG